MGRGSSTEEYRQTIDCVVAHIPDVSITTDVIVGFPGETEGEFEQSFSFCQGLQYSRIHVFSFSPRTGTQAARMPDQIDVKTKKRRSEDMLALASDCLLQYNQRFLGRTLDVLFEQQSGGLWEGLTDNYIRVFSRSDCDLVNTITPVNLVELRGDGVKGRICNSKSEPIPNGA
jgi:threonylcarbamoyladenosine tRNA methylthiotransferase MtaB